jgi:hypothetical protein
MAHAEPVTFSVCGNSTELVFKRAGDSLQVFCPGKPTPVLTFLGCIGPTATRVGSSFTVTCASIKPYTFTPSK